jgi:2-haloacid dehalogenase
VFFDLFGTLLSLQPLDDVCEALAPGAGPDLAARWRARQLELSWLRTAMGRWVDFDEVTSDALRAVLHELGVSPEPAAVTRSAGAFRELPVHPEVPGVLTRLQDGGVVTGILTNASRATLDQVLARTGLAVDHALSVDAARRFKPSPAVYALATGATNLPAERIGFVTGNAWDAAGASAFGFRVAWLRSPGGSPLPAVGAPVAIEAAWPMLPDMFLEQQTR